MEAARTAVEARYLDGHHSLFPADQRRWVELRALLDDVVAFADRMVALGGWDGSTETDDAETSQAEHERLSAELVEPAKVTTLEKLDDTGRSFQLATRWVRSRLESEAASTR